MTDIHIPPAALDAGARAAHDLWRKQASAGDDISEYEQWDDLSRFYKDELRDQARAAITAALGAWTGAFEEYVNNEDGDGASVCVILPKGGDDE